MENRKRERGRKSIYVNTTRNYNVANYMIEVTVEHTYLWTLHTAIRNVTIACFSFPEFIVCCFLSTPNGCDIIHKMCSLFRPISAISSVFYNE